MINFFKNILTYFKIIKNYSQLIIEASKVYSEVTGGVIDDVLTPSEEVLKAYEDYNDDVYLNMYREDIEDILSMFDSTDSVEDLKECLKDYFDIDEDFVLAMDLRRARLKNLIVKAVY